MKSGKSCNFVLLFQNLFRYSRSIAISYIFQDQCVNFYINCWNFDRGNIDLQINLKWTDIITVLKHSSWTYTHLSVCLGVITATFCSFQCTRLTEILNVFLFPFFFPFLVPGITLLTSCLPGWCLCHFVLNVVIVLTASLTLFLNFSLPI